MANIVYFLGAGFSAPLGLPLMSNFVDLSKDMFFRDQEKFPNIKKIMEMINDYSRIKHYVRSDLFNIEEMLSVLEMADTISGGSHAKEFAEYIKDVIKYYTPQIPAPLLSNYGNGGWGPKGTERDYGRSLFGSDADLIAKYAYFISSLAGLHMRCYKPSSGSQRIELCKPDSKHTYSVITTNYDMLIQNFLSHIDTTFREKEAGVHYSTALTVIKLHGSVDSTIIPPSWRKTEMTSCEEVGRAWKDAGKLLAQANYIGIIGYSLPDSDVCVRYLFKAALHQSENLKSIRVICFDPNGSVERRYNSLFEERFLEFQKAKFENLLNVSDLTTYHYEGDSNSPLHLYCQNLESVYL
jgi:hypothetical protein